ncbi:MAG: alpha/beta hydrolase [Myxococcales bacterium]|nr:alpha/beta hydrolase [Myxococcales bacterium]
MSGADPVIRFFRGPTGHRIAYATHGRGPYLVCGAWWVSHVEEDWADAGFRRFFGGLAEHHTVVRYDRPGSGLSDRQRSRVDLSGEVETLTALVSHLQAQSPTQATVDLLGISCGGPPVLTYAANHRESVGRILLIGSFVRGADVGNQQLRDAIMALVRAHWGMGAATIANLFAPDLDSEAVRRMGKRQRATASAETAARLVALTFDADVAEVAQRVTAPALVLHRRHDHTIPRAAGADLAAALPNGSLQTLEGTAHVPWLGSVDEMLLAARSFLSTGNSAPQPVASADPDEAHWTRRGDLWTVAYDGATAHVKHARGMEDMARLLSCPDQEIHAAALYRSDGAGPATTAGSDPILDDQAVQAYRARLLELQQSAEEAREHGAAEEAERLESERDALTQQLAGALGLGKRKRGLGDGAERARKAVTARVRASIHKIAQVHPTLAEHLSTQITTGNFCCYRSVPGVSWRIE